MRPGGSLLLMSSRVELLKEKVKISKLNKIDM